MITKVAPVAAPLAGLGKPVAFGGNVQTLAKTAAATRIDVYFQISANTGSFRLLRWFGVLGPANPQTGELPGKWVPHFDGAVNVDSAVDGGWVWHSFQVLDQGGHYALEYIPGNGGSAADVAQAWMEPGNTNPI